MGLVGGKYGKYIRIIECFMDEKGFYMQFDGKMLRHLIRTDK